MQNHEPVWRQMKRQKSQAGDILGHLGIRTPPVDVRHVAEMLGVDIHDVPEPGWDGALRSDAHEAHIWVNAGHHPVRQRFTIAHELGHLMLHPEGMEFRDAAGTRGSYSPKETQANQFAADLLMPAWMVRNLAQEFGPNPAKLSRIFEVSEEAMSYRLRNLFL